MKTCLKMLLEMQTGKKRKEGEEGHEEKEEDAEDSLAQKQKKLLQRLAKDPLAERRGLANVEKFGGTTSFKEWRFSLRGVLDTEPLLAQRLDAVEQAALLKTCVLQGEQKPRYLELHRAAAYR